MNTWQRDVGSKLNINKVKTISRTLDDYADRFLIKFTYFFYNSNVIYNLSLNPDSQISIAKLEQLLFQDKELSEIYACKIIEQEKVQFELSCDQNISIKLHDTLVIIKVISEYLLNTIDTSYDNDYGNNEKYNDMLEIKCTYIDVFLETISDIFEKYLNNNSEFLEKYENLMVAFKRKDISWGDSGVNMFISTIFNNNNLILNKKFQDKLSRAISCQERGINIFDCPKILKK